MHNVPHTSEAKAKMSKSHQGIPLYYKRRKTMIVNEAILYKCGTCGEYLCADKYHKDKRMSDGLKSQCKKCHSECAIRTRDKNKYNNSKRASEALRRARKVNSIIGKVDYEWLSKLLGGNCLRCGSPKNIQWDHIVALSKGGEHSNTNMQPLCRKCNEKKQAHTADYRSEQQKVWVIEFKKI